MKLLREPLVHFLLIGAVMFALYAKFGQPANEAPPGVIVITPGLIENFKVSFARSGGQPPTEVELNALIDDYIREEIFVREARAKGLDQDDALVRRELRTRMEMLYEDSVQTPVPTDAELTVFLTNNPDKFKRSDGSLPTLADARDAVQDAWTRAQRKDALDAAYKKLRERYTVKMPPPAATTTAASPPQK